MPSLSRIGCVRADAFVTALTATIIIATLLPCQGTSARIFHVAGTVAIASLFFLQGARLSRAAVVAGLTNYRPHALMAGTTFLLFPFLGCMLAGLAQHALNPSLLLGVPSCAHCPPRSSPRRQRDRCSARCRMCADMALLACPACGW